MANTQTLDIRHRIYELAVEDANAWRDVYWVPEDDETDDEDLHEDRLFAYRKSMLPQLVPPDQRYRRGYHTPNTVEDWSQLSRKYLGLSQACSQIRQEFMPLFAMIWTSVHLRDLDKYLHDFIVPQSDKVADLRGCIDVGVDDEDRRTNFLYAMVMINEAHLRVKFSTRDKDEYYEITDGITEDLALAVLDAEEFSPKFWTLVKEKASSVQLGIMQERAFSDDDGMPKGSYHIYEMTIVIKKDLAEDWMLKAGVSN